MFGEANEEVGTGVQVGGEAQVKGDGGNTGYFTGDLHLYTHFY